MRGAGARNVDLTRKKMKQDVNVGLEGLRLVHFIGHFMWPFSSGMQFCSRRTVYGMLLAPFVFRVPRDSLQVAQPLIVEKTR
jgi:hypothetical protein